MIAIKSDQEIALMRDAGRLVAKCHQEVAKLIRPGITTWEIDQFVEGFIKSHGAIAEQIGYHGYKYATCASVNDEICHGFPRKVALQEGDIVGIDFVINLGGWLGDSCWSYPVGKVSNEAQRLLDVTLQSLYIGIEHAVAGNRLGDIGHAIQSFVESHGYSVVRDFTGHGIGRVMHEAPQVTHFGQPHTGVKIREGMVFTIEPMVNQGTYRCDLDDNGWTARTSDGSLSAQYEHTIAITKDGPVILTTL